MVSKFCQWSNRAWIAFIATACLVATGCAQKQRREQLERVAKDWCETIRASQVIPVYPLTEDLRPGDVFLVQRPVGRQQEEWRTGGYLTLDDHRVRLGYVDPPTSPPNTMAEMYRRMYFDGYWKDGFGKEPNPRPIISNPGPIKPGDPITQLSNANAPRAAFPAYSFEVVSGGGTSLALPIKGVPVGLSFMKTESADGTVTLADAYTYGADALTLYNDAMTWATDPVVASMLDGAARQSQGEKDATSKPIFLRVVCRVYLVGSVSVSLVSREQGGGSADVGAKQEVSILDPNTAAPKAGFSKLLETLDAGANASRPVDAAGKLLPGGSVKFAWASERSISLSETFDKPLVIGYLGLDIPVFAGAEPGVPEFGYPLPTWTVLNESVGRLEPAVVDIKPITDAMRGKLDGGDAQVIEVLNIMKRTCDRAVAENVADIQADRLRFISGKCDDALAMTDAAARQAAASQLFSVQFVPQTSIASSGRGKAKYARILSKEYSSR
ncbi:MAG: hypothetical protein IT438_16835 [Phycisphaerales bacterium]|nr:hypothetical protein [Phycisphaerales bacterium]